MKLRPKAEDGEFPKQVFPVIRGEPARPQTEGY